MIYLDNAATTRVYDEAQKIAAKYMTEVYGNAGSLHSMGVSAEKALTTSRKIIAAAMGCDEKSIIFTSGATEANNMVFSSVRKRRGKNKIILSEIEHASVYAPAKYLESQGYELVVLKVDSSGLIDIDELISKVDDKTALVSIMLVNNEISTIQDIAEISKRLREVSYTGYIHTDATQAVCKLSVRPQELGVDFLTASAHKFHGPKGVGFLYAKNVNVVEPILIGGSQEGLKRAGTENIPLIASMAKAVAISLGNMNEFYNNASVFYSKIYDYASSSDFIRPVVISTDNLCRHIISLAYKNLKSEVLLHAFEVEGIALSSGSACSSKSKKISRVLQAISLPEDYQEGVIRISFSRYTTMEDIDSFIRASEKIIKEVKKIK